MTLRTGTELISLLLLLNKLSGLYGLLAILTGIQLSPLQLTMYIYSVLALILTALLAPHIRQAQPLPNLALAWFYLIDSIINAGYTAAFSLTWLVVVASAHTASQFPTTGGASTIKAAAGFTSPIHNVSHVDVHSARPPSGSFHSAVAVGHHTATGTQLPHGGVFIPESETSLAIIAALWLVRVYFILVVMAHARGVLRSHVRTTLISPDVNIAAIEPFATGTAEGEGWRGRLGRSMVRIGRRYWLGGMGVDDEEQQEDLAWAQHMGGRFEKKRIGSAAAPMGNIQAERERRRRAGTGPPLPRLDGFLSIPLTGGKV